ncbi:hypothetical protein BpHYR1_011906 [Brachionus plicatilis]|uniref:G-protein coupled receptors family 1 profile domain-containing protein n=1 Tax=Brachionus plicatilis TaxID=10195 RepID=A0A3M7RHS6_BRAPC|nr:hypothetical protein BpHYR1_011906 [Brachionus plicatilis]
MSFLIAILNIPLTLEYLKIDNLNSTSNGSLPVIKRNCVRSKTVKILSDTITALLRSIIPLVLFLIFNSLMLKTLIDSKRKIARNIKIKREIQFGLSLFLTNTVFLVLNLPLAIIYLVENFANLSPIQYEEIVFAHFIADAIAYFNFGVYFFLNAIFNYSFRKEFVVLSKTNLNLVKKIF